MASSEGGPPPDTNGGPGVLAEYYVLLILAVVLVAMRSYVRLRISNSWGWDDWTILIAVMFLIAGVVFCTMEVNLGLGRHIMYLANPEYQALQILRWNTYFQMVNVGCTLFTKVSISIYILRIKDSRALRWTLFTMMLLMTLATIAVLIVLSRSCTPLEKLWEPTVPGTCLPLATVYNVAYVQSAFTIVTDLCLTVSPVVILWNVKIRRGRKTFILFLTSLGLVATISNALRNLFQPDLTAKDFTYAIIPITVVAILELNSGVIAACVPACMPLFKIKERGSTYGPSGNYASQGHSMRTAPSRKAVDVSQARSNYFPGDYSSLNDEEHSLTGLKPVVNRDLPRAM